MSAPADKVQLTLQNLLQQSLPLIHKGIFTKAQLKQIMSMREKHQKNMLKTTFKVPDYLKAIQYQYQLERQRRFRVDTADSKINPILKKQSKTDFVIIKRIIRLWDRTMHKFKYRADLWKQYLSFALAIQSKKIFYKALSNGLKFLPFNVDLWKIGVQYQIEIQSNLWKARKIFMKAVRINKNKIQMWLGFIEFEFLFLRRILQRQKIIKGQEINQPQGIKFFMAKGQNQPGKQNMQIQDDENEQQENQDQKDQKINLSSIDVKNYHSVIWLIIQEAFLKCESIQKNQIYKIFKEKLNQEYKKCQQKDEKQLVQILKNLKKLIEQYKQKENLNQKIQIQNKQILIQEEQQIINTYENLKAMKIPIQKSEQLEFYKAWVQYFKGQNKIDWQVIAKGLSNFCLKPQYFSQLVIELLNIDFEQTMDVLISKFQKYTFKGTLISRILEILIQSSSDDKQKQEQDQNSNDNFQKIKQKCNSFVQSKIKSLSFENQFIKDRNLKLLKNIINYNKASNQFKENNNLHRGLSVLCKKNPDIVEFAGNLIKKN